MRLTKRVDLPLLQDELTAAGVPHNGLSTGGSLASDDYELFTADDEGVLIEPPPEAQPVVDAHVAPPLVIEHVETITVGEIVRTTNDAETDVFILPAAPKSIYRAELEMSAIDAASGAVKFMAGILVWKRLLGSNVIAPPANITVVSDVHDTAAASWIMNGLPSGGSFRVFVKGAAGRTIDWSLVGTVARYAPEGLG